MARDFRLNRAFCKVLGSDPHNVSEEARGLYLVGAGTHPGAGLPGVISSAEVLSKLVPDAPVAQGKARMAAE